MWESGFRPVVYADSDWAHRYRDALAEIHGTGWAALVVEAQMRTGLTRADWTAEREWRYCFPPGAEGSAVNVSDHISAVIVGQSGWVPYLTSAPQRPPVERWL